MSVQAARFTFSRWHRFVWGMAAAVACICAFVPLNVSMPAAALDSSWMYAINEAVARHLVIGHDVVFTMGPFASIYSGQYNPATDAMVLSGSLYLALCYAYLVGVICRGRGLVCILFLVTIPYLAFYKDTLYSSYSLYLVVASYAAFTPAGARRGSAVPLGLAAAGIGLLIAVKVSFIWLGVLSVLASAAVLLVRRRWPAAVLVALAPVAGLCISWIVAGQPLWGLADYLRMSIPITTGYTEAMAFEGSVRDIAVFLVAACLVLAATLAGRRLAWPWRLCLAAFLALYLLISFKGGFVRHDGHSVIAGTAVVIAAAVVWAVKPGRAGIVAFFAAVAALVSIESRNNQAMRDVLVTHFLIPFRDAARAGASRIEVGLQGRFDAAVRTIRSDFPIPVLAGTSDLYMFNTAVLLASGNKWDPRPVLQSYSAYTPSLQLDDAAHLAGKSAPDHLFFKPEAVDGRLPSMEDAPSWMEILQRYRPGGTAGDFLILDRRAGDTPSKPVLQPLVTTAARLGQAVEVPGADGVVVAKIHVHRGLVSKLAAVLFKPAPMGILLTLADGRQVPFRFISENAETGFVLSPLITTGPALAQTMTAGPDNGARVVRSFTLTQVDRLGGAADRYELELSRMALPPEAGAGSIFTPLSEAKATAPIPVAPCEGAIDTVDGMPVASELPGSTTLSVAGWVAAGGAAGVSPDSVTVTFTDAAGNVFSAPARSMVRPDVAAALRQPGLTHSGFLLLADTVGLHGRFVLGLQTAVNSQQARCQNLHQTVVFH